MRFTKENAAEYGRKGAQGYLRAIAERKKRLAEIPSDAEQYVQVRLMRVRAQLNKLDEMIAEEEDPQKLDRLASAQSRLSAQEFALAGRPLPGSRRPGREKTTRATGASAPIDAE